MYIYTFLCYISNLGRKLRLNEKTCIICRKIKDNKHFNIEHIIPESIGNKKLTIDAVCEECNSRLGTKIEPAITNNFLSELARYTDQIKGKSGSIPFPFKNGTTEDGRKIQSNSNGEISFIPKVEHDDENSEIRVSANSIDEAVKIIKKKMKRLNQPTLSDLQLQEVIKTARIKNKHPSINIQKTIDINKVNTGIIKIAYEFAYYLIGTEYLKDPQGKKIANIFYDYIYNNKKNCSINQYLRPLKKNENQKHVLIIKSLGKDIFNNKNIHYIKAVKTNNEILIDIILFSSIRTIVSVSYADYNFEEHGYLINPKDGQMTRI